MVKDITAVKPDQGNILFDYLLDQESMTEEAVSFVQSLFTNDELIKSMTPKLVEEMQKKLATIGQEL